MKKRSGAAMPPNGTIPLAGIVCRRSVNCWVAGNSGRRRHFASGTWSVEAAAPTIPTTAATRRLGHCLSTPHQRTLRDIYVFWTSTGGRWKPGFVPSAGSTRSLTGIRLQPAVSLAAIGTPCPFPGRTAPSDVWNGNCWRRGGMMAPGRSPSAPWSGWRPMAPLLRRNRC